MQTGGYVGPVDARGMPSVIDRRTAARDRVIYGGMTMLKRAAPAVTTTAPPAVESKAGEGGGYILAALAAVAAVAFMAGRSKK